MAFLWELVREKATLTVFHTAGRRVQSEEKKREKSNKVQILKHPWEILKDARDVTDSRVRIAVASQRVCWLSQ